MFKRSLLFLVLLSLSIIAVQAQDSCDLQTVDEYIERGNTSYYARDYDAAIVDYNCANALEEGYSAYYNLGLVYYYQGDYDAAIAALSSALEFEPNDLNSLDFRSSLYMEQGLYDEALADIDLMLEIDSENASAYLSRAWFYVYKGEVNPGMHQDFLNWMQLNEENAFEVTMEEAAAYESLPIAVNQNYYISFDAEAGNSFSAAASSAESLDPLLVLIAPDGTAIASDDDGGKNLNAVISRFELPQSGTYTLVLGQAGAAGEGEIELSVILDNQLFSTSGENTSDLRSDFAPYNLFVGDTAEVFTTAGDHLNLRAEPNIDSEIIDRLEYGERVTLLEGPRKEGGYSWWRIRTADGLEGWSVERVETEQTLQLALIPGEEAFVITLDELLNVRETPARGGELAFQLSDGARVTLLEEEPVVADGFRWWHIRDASGREGWAVDRTGIERTLAPAREFPNR